MKLDTKKLKQLKEKHSMTYRELALRAGLNSREHAFYLIKSGSLKYAIVWGRIFDVEPVDLLLWE